MIMYVDLYYEGFCVIDEDLFEVVNIKEYEQIDIWNVNNGECFIIYVICVECGLGVIFVNGLVVCCVVLGDILIIVIFVVYNEIELVKYELELIYVDLQNCIICCGYKILI